MEQHKAKFKVGDVVQVVIPFSEFKEGDIGVIRGYAGSVLPYIVDFMCEIEGWSSAQDYIGWRVAEYEIQLHKETKVLNILRQYEANTKRSKGL